MAEVRNYARLWPLAIAAVGVGGFVFAAYRWTSNDAHQVDIEESDEPVTDAGPNEHFEKVRAHLIDEFTTYTGAVRAEGIVPVRAPQGMRVPIVRVHHEQGDFVKKGDVLVTFAREQVDRAIEQAKAKGDTVNEQRFRGYLDFVELTAPVDGVVLEIHRTLGEVPLDEGIPIVTLADRSSYRFVVTVPGEVQRASMVLGTKFDVVLQDDLGTVAGTVADFGGPEGDNVPVVLGLAPHEGIEDRLAGTIRVISGRKEVGLIPRAAVVKRGDVDIVRVHDPATKSIGEKTVRLGDAVGPDVVILAGVYVDESIVAPGRKRDP